MSNAHPEQAENLKRVYGNLHEAVLAFVKLHEERALFNMIALTKWVQGNSSFSLAPDSPGRILRELRREGLIDYEVVNRAASLYRIKRAA